MQDFEKELAAIVADNKHKIQLDEEASCHPQCYCPDCTTHLFSTERMEEMDEPTILAIAMNIKNILTREGLNPDKMGTAGKALCLHWVKEWLVANIIAKHCAGAWGKYTLPDEVRRNHANIKAGVGVVVSRHPLLNLLDRETRTPVILEVQTKLKAKILRVRLAEEEV